jgi:hypothetical protein
VAGVSISRRTLDGAEEGKEGRRLFKLGLDIVGNVPGVNSLRQQGTSLKRDTSVYVLVNRFRCKQVRCGCRI